MARIDEKNTVIDVDDNKKAAATEAQKQEEVTCESNAKNNPDQKVRLKSSDMDVFEVSTSLAYEADALKNLIDDGRAAGGCVVRLPCVGSRELIKVIEYWNRHSGASSSSCHGLARWDAEFVTMARDDMRALIRAATYLSDRPLLKLLHGAADDSSMAMLRLRRPEWPERRNPGMRRRNL